MKTSLSSADVGNRRRTGRGSEMSLELFVFIIVVGVASGLIYGVAIAKWRKDQRSARANADE